MGTATAGIAFRPTPETDNFSTLISTLFGTQYLEIPYPKDYKFDIRHEGDVLVEAIEDVVFIHSDALAWSHLENVDSDVQTLYRQLGAPEHFMIFCKYDSGGSYGYAFVDKGVRTRSRLQLLEATPVEFGEPTYIERQWFSAPHYLEEGDKFFYLEHPQREDIGEYFLTDHILAEELVDRFGYCPWIDMRRPSYTYFRDALRVCGPAAR